MARINETTVACFMDGIDWEHHLEADAFGTKLFPSVASLVQMEPHVRPGGCGIVEVEVRLIRWVEPQDLHGEKLHGGEDDIGGKDERHTTDTRRSGDS